MVCALLAVYAAAVLIFPEKAVVNLSVPVLLLFIFAGVTGCVILQKHCRKLKEMGELTQLTRDKAYEFIPEEDMDMPQGKYQVQDTHTA